MTSKEKVINLTANDKEIMKQVNHNADTVLTECGLDNIEAMTMISEGSVKVKGLDAENFKPEDVKTLVLLSLMTYARYCTIIQKET